MKEGSFWFENQNRKKNKEGSFCIGGGKFKNYSWPPEYRIQNYKAIEPLSLLSGIEHLFSNWIDFTYLFELHFPISLRIDDTIRVKMTVMKLSKKWRLQLKHQTSQSRNELKRNTLKYQQNKKKDFFSSKILSLKIRFYTFIRLNLLIWFAFLTKFQNW